MNKSLIAISLTHTFVAGIAIFASAGCAVTTAGTPEADVGQKGEELLPKPPPGMPDTNGGHPLGVGGGTFSTCTGIKLSSTDPFQSLLAQYGCVHALQTLATSRTVTNLSTGESTTTTSASDSAALCPYTADVQTLVKAYSQTPPYLSATVPGATSMCDGTPVGPPLTSGGPATVEVSWDPTCHGGGCSVVIKPQP